jgi:23S rRNA (cytosine1962-C5)-methyltransferase
MNEIRLKPGREKSVLQGHPWVFSGAISTEIAVVEPGEIVRVTDAAGTFLAYAFCNKSSKIACRILERNESSPPDYVFVREKILRAISIRKHLLDEMTDSCRLFFSEADGLPGLVVDRFSAFLVVQIHTAGMERFRNTVLETLSALDGISGIVEQSDPVARSLENLPLAKGVLLGPQKIPTITLRENGLVYSLDFAQTQKTGFYLDQRMNRASVAKFSRGREVLDCFSYTGGFALNCLRAGAKSVLRIDSSSAALEQGATNIELNGYSLQLSPSCRADVFEILRQFRNEGKTFEMIILDPPKLAPTRAQAEKALRAYKDLNVLAMKLLVKGGILATFSCSSGISVEDFRTMCAWSATDAKRNVQLLERLGQPEDHPVLLAFPEGEYLKGLVLRILD